MRLLLLPREAARCLQSRAWISEGPHPRCASNIRVEIKSSHVDPSARIAQAPEEGEDFSKVQDDYEKLILPGTSSLTERAATTLVDPTHQA